MAKIELVILAATAACAGHAAPPAAAPPAPAAAPPAAKAEALQAPAGMRLPRAFLPVAYTARLALAPTDPKFRGHIEIEGDLASPSRVIWLHAQGLTFDGAVATAGSARTPLETVALPGEVVALRAPAELPAGHLTLAIDYAGSVSSDSPDGVFRQQSSGAWYVFSQFESTSARRAFPCFDEPDVKVPWQLTLDVPAGVLALSNTNAASDTASEDRATHRVVFARTKPLPSYLIAFAVGTFDLINAPPSRNGTPVRIVVPHGQAAAAAAIARDDTGPLLARLEDYLGIPYPYDKLDLVAVPSFPGAMENAGLITFAQLLLLEDPAQATIAHRRAFASVAAHEMAHQWFGDMVTMAWWDDVWLNEAFATWLATKVVDQWQPGWAGAFNMVEQKTRAMASDQLAAARKIRQPIERAADIDNAFDAITYDKGASVLRMFERWIGAETFQRGVHGYLAAQAWHNATVNDFLGAIGAAAGRDITAPFSTFLDQAGTPLVSVGLRCAAGSPPVVTLAQQRYRASGGGGEPANGEHAAAERPWQLPVCVRYSAGAASARDCTLLDRASAELPLTHATGCPAWLMPNADALGYQRTAYEGDLLPHLLAHFTQLTPVERLSLVEDINALVAAGRMQAGDALAQVNLLAGDPDRHVVGAAIGIAQQADAVIDDASRPRYRRFVRNAFGKRANALGWASKPSDTDDVRLLRASLVGFVADAAQDPALIAGATRLAWAWLDNRKTAPADIADRALAVAAGRNDRKLYDRLVAEIKRTTDASERAHYMNGLGHFTDPALIAANLDLVLSGTVSLLDAFSAFLGEDHTPAQRRATWEVFKAHYDAVAALLPPQFATRLSIVGFVVCDPALRDDVIEFLRGRLASDPQTLAQGIERMDSCIARRRAAQPSVAAFLSRN